MSEGLDELRGSGAWLPVLPSRYAWSINGGGTASLSFEGPTDTMATFLATVSAAGLAGWEIVKDGQLSTVGLQYGLTAADGQVPGSDGKIDDYWELEGNDIEKSLWEHPKVVAVTASYTAAELASLRSKVEQILAGTEVTLPANTDLAALVHRLARGTEAFSVSSHVLRHTVTVTRASTLAAAHTNVNKRFTYTQLTTAEPTLASSGLIAASGLTALKWLKRSPRVRAVDSGFWELEQEYWGADSIDEWIYDERTV